MAFSPLQQVSPKMERSLGITEGRGEGIREFEEGKRKRDKVEE
jgi:hypothetical protein